MYPTEQNQDIAKTLAVAPDILGAIKSGAPKAELVTSLLQGLASIHNAENVFLITPDDRDDFLVPHSATIDGYSVPEAADRTPITLIHAAAREEGALFSPHLENQSQAIQEAFSQLGRKGALLYRLNPTSPSTAWVYLENRFCPLDIHETALCQAQTINQAIRFSFYAWTLQEKLQERQQELEKAEALVADFRQQNQVEKKVKPATSPSRRKAHKHFTGDYSTIITQSSRMHSIFSVIDKIAHTSAPVLIMGESGTGKELVATAIHANSPRAGKPFVPENCAALTETLLESELFGYVKGAFTGAHSDRKGLFEIANGGTLFLDEVGEMSLNMQKKLLRVLQEGVIRRVGGKDYIPVDVRIISATNRDLAVDTQKMSFREDLFYRLNVITIELPPLSQRTEDIPLLVAHFLDKLVSKNNQAKSVLPDTMTLLKHYPWPGNIRELQNEVQRMVALSGEVIEPSHLSEKIHKPIDNKQAVNLSGLSMLPLKEAMQRFEQAFLTQALKKYQHNKTKVATELKIPKTSLYQKLKKYKLQ